MKRSDPLLLVLLFVCPFVRAQSPDTVQLESAAINSLNTFFTHDDSLRIFDLIDSILTMEGVEEKSQLAVRLGYNSNITADNRTFDISKFGLSPGVSYYHKSGVYADVSAYWSQEYDPNYYLTVASTGFMHTYAKWYSLLFEYSHYFYNQPSTGTLSVPYTNNVGATNYFEWKFLMMRLDYYFYFGDKVAHRIIPAIGLNLVKRNWLGFNRISFYPSYNLMMGSEQTEQYYDRPILRSRLGLPLSYTTTAFGIMNHAFSIPLCVTKKDWTFLVGYVYNIPVPLPNEELSLQEGGYLSFSITKYFTFR